MRKIAVLIFTCSLSALLFTACKKDKVTEVSGTEIADVRTSGALKTVALNFTPGSETIAAITLANTSDEDGDDILVKLSLNNEAVTAAKLMPLPANAYTLSSLQYLVPTNGSIAVPILINRSNLTVDTTYGIGFTISEVSNGQISQDAKSIVVKITLRNRWDGVYKVTGSMIDVTDPTYGLPEHEIYLVTTSPTQVKMIPVKLGIEGALIKVGINLSYYANFGPVINFNEGTNKITSVTNFYGQPASDTRSAELDPSGGNSWTADSRKIELKYWMNQPNVVAGHRSTFTNTFTVVRDR